MGNNSNSGRACANLLAGELVIRSMLALGVDHFVVSPGSRSSPLVLPMQHLGRDKYTVVLDERSAAFRAVGRIKASRRPVALVCTSGTAGAHYLPAVIEARESGLPLVVLTADRPPELRHCHAGQTIDQLKLFGSYPVFHAELPVPGQDELLLRQVREICRVAVEASMGSPGGPVHLNCPFREPLLPVEGEPPVFDSRLIAGLKAVRQADSCSANADPLPARTLILAGPRSAMEREPGLAALARLACEHDWPILADAANPLRHRSDLGAPVIVHYDRIARDDVLWDRLKPDAVVLWGEPPTSRVLRERLAEMDLPGYLVSDGKRAINPIHGRIQWTRSTIEGFAPACTGERDGFAGSWADADRRINTVLLQKLEQPHPLFEGDIHRFLPGILPESSALVVANSLAVRDAEWFMPLNAKRLLPFSQRGANGIDGTVSLSRGIADGLQSPVWLVTGDLAFLHDSNGLLDSAGAAYGLFVILMNNQGGGIFELLPVAGKCDRFEELFATPQPVDVAQLVQAHGGEHRLCDSTDSLGEAVLSWNKTGLFVAEFKIDRKLGRELRRQYLVLQDH